MYTCKEYTLYETVYSERIIHRHPCPPPPPPPKKKGKKNLIQPLPVKLYLTSEICLHQSTVTNTGMDFI